MSLHTLVRELLDDDHEIDDASDIPTDMRAQIIRAWRETASKAEINEAYLAGEDDDDMATLLAFALDEVLTHEGQQAMLRCFWAGMSWRVDKAIMEVKARNNTMIYFIVITPFLINKTYPAGFASLILSLIHS